MKLFSESDIEQIAISYFRNLGYSGIHATAISSDGENKFQYKKIIVLLRKIIC
jgi:hypothetical protein